MCRLINNKLIENNDLALSLNFEFPVYKAKVNSEEDNDIPEEIIDLAEQRKQARLEKNWEESDRLRDLIQSKGYIIKDNKEGYEISK